MIQCFLKRINDRIDYQFVNATHSIKNIIFLKVIKFTIQSVHINSQYNQFKVPSNSIPQLNPKLINSNNFDIITQLHYF